MKKSELKAFLDEMVLRYNNKSFIQLDPISIPHQFTIKQDIEISAFLTASIAWGKRGMILNSAKKLMQIMDNKPYEFVLSYTQNDRKFLNGFVHRTFNSDDLHFFIASLQKLYQQSDSLEIYFLPQKDEIYMFDAIERFRESFLGAEHNRTSKHISSPTKGSAAKRINMFLRWMVRRDNNGVDFGIWEKIPCNILSCPLDVHTGNVARELGMINRTQNDLKTLIQLDIELRKMDTKDPVKYDFALFGMGVEGKEVLQNNF